MRILVTTTVLCLLTAVASAQDQPQQQISELIRRLDDDNWSVRAGATETLFKLGHGALPELRKAAKSSKSLEVRLRAGQLIAKLVILDDLGSSEQRVRLAALRQLKKLSWPRRFAKFREGLWHPNPRTAQACAWALSYDYLDVREIERKVAVLLPRLRIMDIEPIEGLEKLTECTTGLEDYRRHFSFDHLSQVLAQFPPPDKRCEYTPNSLLSQIHRRISGDHVPALLDLTRRTTDLPLVEAAFWQAVEHASYAQMHLGKLASRILELDPCVGHGQQDRPALKPQKRPELPAKLGLPPMFIAILEQYYFCKPCRRANKHRWVGPLLAAWGRDFTPASTDLPTLLRLTEKDEPPLIREWAVLQLGKLALPASKKRLAVMMNLSDDEASERVRLLAAFSLGRLGQQTGQAFLAKNAIKNQLALFLLHDLDDKAYSRLLPLHLNELELGDIPRILIDGRTARLELGLRLTDSALNAIGDWLLAECLDPAVLCDFFRQASGGPRKQAALGALALTQKEEHWPLDTSQTGFLEVWAPTRLETELKRRSATGDDKATAMLNRLSGVRARPKVNSAQLTQWLEQRHLGRYWEAQKILTMAGDPKATEVYMSMIRKGYYQQWNSCYLDALPWKLTDVPRVLEWASATCCTRVEVEAIWKGLFGNNSVKSVFRGQKFAPLRERLAQHWQIHQGSLRYSKIARHFMPGPTKKR